MSTYGYTTGSYILVHYMTFRENYLQILYNNTNKKSKCKYE